MWNRDRLYAVRTMQLVRCSIGDGKNAHTLTALTEVHTLRDEDNG
jgi:hypothetical protein